jgi:CHRD domain
VKKPAVSSAALVALGIALGLAGGASGAGEATAIRVATTLNAAQEVPTPTGDVGSARGTFTASVDASATGATVAWELTFSGLTGTAVAAHIHTAARGTPGPVSVPLCGPVPEPCEWDGKYQRRGARGAANGRYVHQCAYADERPG